MTRKDARIHSARQDKNYYVQVASKEAVDKESGNKSLKLERKQPEPIEDRNTDRTEIRSLG